MQLSFSLVGFFYFIFVGCGVFSFSSDVNNFVRSFMSLFFQAFLCSFRFSKYVGF